jgi:hypothetical protein
MEINLCLLPFSSSNEAKPEKILRNRSNMGFGFMSYTRQTLLDALKAGERLKIRGVGICQFSDDVSADLADRAVASFAFKGKLIASPAVQAVLLRKKA